MKINWGKVALIASPFLTTGATAFLDYLVNSQSPFSKATLAHAAVATALVEVTILKQMLSKQAAEAK